MTLLIYNNIVCFPNLYTTSHREEVESYSPHYHIAEVAKEMKVLMSHGEEDSPPFKSQGNDYFKVHIYNIVYIMAPY